MVLAALVIFALILVIGVPTIKNAFSSFSKTDEERKREQAKADRDEQKQLRQEEEGVGGTLLRIALGDAAVDAQKEKNQLKAIQDQQKRLEDSGLIPKGNAPALTTLATNKIVEEEIIRAGGRKDQFLIPLSPEKMTEINNAVANASRKQLEDIVNAREKIVQVEAANTSKKRIGRTVR